MSKLDLSQKYFIDISDLRIEPHWGFTCFKNCIQEQKLKYLLDVPERKSVQQKVFLSCVGLFSMFMLTSIIGPFFIPNPDTLSFINIGFKDFKVIIMFLSIAGYIVFAFIKVKSRFYSKKSNTKEHMSIRSYLTLIMNSIDNKDFIPLSIILGINYAYELRSSDYEFYSNPLPYLFEQTLDASLILNVSVKIFTFGLLISIFLFVVFQIWGYTEKQQRKLIEYGDSKGFIFNSTKTKSFFWFIPSFKRKRKFIDLARKEGERINLEKTPIDINIQKVWRVLNPKFEIYTIWYILLGLLSFYICISYLESHSVLESQMQLLLMDHFFLIISSILLFAFGIYMFILAFKPINDYIKFRKKMIQISSKLIDDLFLKANKQEGKFDKLELLYLQEYHARHRKSPLLPLGSFSTSMIFLLPIIGQFVFLLLRI